MKFIAGDLKYRKPEGSYLHLRQRNLEILLETADGLQLNGERLPFAGIHHHPCGRNIVISRGIMLPTIRVMDSRMVSEVVKMKKKDDLPRLFFLYGDNIILYRVTNKFRIVV